MNIGPFVEKNAVLVLAVLAALFVVTAALRIATPAAFIGMAIGGIVMWRYGRSPAPLVPLAEEDEEEVAA